MPPPPAPRLPDELIEEIFLRLPPDEPASLVRASLANKDWLRLLTGPAFGTRYREHHGSRLMLGFLLSMGWNCSQKPPFPPFVSSTNFEANKGDFWEDPVNVYTVWDCRHGRVLFCVMNKFPMKFVVWDPMTGSRKEANVPDDFDIMRAAVLCAVSGCDHRACHDGPFRVVLVGLDDDGSSYVYESESSEWSKHGSGGYNRDSWEVWCVTFTHHDDLVGDAYIKSLAPVLVEDVLYLMLSYQDDGQLGILKYDLGSECLSLMDAPLPLPLAETDITREGILLAMEDGSLGFARVDGLTLNLWSMQMGYEGGETWTQRMVINLKNLLPIHNLKPRFLGSVERSDIIFVTTDLGIYQVHLKSLQWKKIWKTEKCLALIPYMRF